MKFRTSLIVAMLALMPCFCGAFTLDAVGYSGSELSSAPYSMFVPGYGEIVFQTGPSDAITLVSAFINDSGSGAPSVDFDESESVKITYNNAPAGETGDVVEGFFAPPAVAFIVGNASEAIAAPEADAALILAGVAILALRRRR